MDILSEEDEQRVDKANNTDEVFIVIAKYWSFLDFVNLEDIVEHSCGEAEQKMMQEYGREVKRFCEKRVSEFPCDALRSDNDHAGMEEVYIALDLTNPSLNRIKDLKYVIANILGISASKLILINIGDGSIVAIFLITTSVATKISSLTEEQRATLKAAQVISLKFQSTGLIVCTQVKTATPCKFRAIAILKILYGLQILSIDIIWHAYIAK